MLEFIVLGQIPGTNIHITIAWFVLVFFGLLIWLDLKFHKRHANDQSIDSNETDNTVVKA